VDRVIVGYVESWNRTCWRHRTAQFEFVSLPERKRQRVPVWMDVGNDNTQEILDVLRASFAHWPGVSIRIEPHDDRPVPERRALGCDLMDAMKGIFGPRYKRIIYRAFDMWKARQELAEHRSRPSGKRRSKRRRTGGTRPLTPLQTQALELYGKHNGKLTDIAREMGIKHSTAHQHLQAGFRKVPGLAPKKAPSAGRTRRLPRDRRGQPTVADNDE